MDLYIVASYVPCIGQHARVYMDGIYNTFEDAEQRQRNICGGSVVSTNLGNNSMYGGNRRITWMKKVKFGDLQKLDIYSPDPLPKHTHT
jgi:hypothetical protein